MEIKEKKNKLTKDAKKIVELVEQDFMIGENEIFVPIKNASIATISEVVKYIADVHNQTIHARKVIRIANNENGQIDVEVGIKFAPTREAFKNDEIGSYYSTIYSFPEVFGFKYSTSHHGRGTAVSGLEFIGPANPENRGWYNLDNFLRCFSEAEINEKTINEIALKRIVLISKRQEVLKARTSR